MKFSQLSRRLLRRIYARELVNSAYTALLDRPVDAQASRRYADLICTDAGGETSFLKVLLESDEFRQHAYGKAAPQLVESMYRALLGREPETAAVAQYTERLTGSHAFEQVLSGIAQSDEHRSRIYEQNIAHTVASVCWGVTGKSLDGFSDPDRASVMSAAEHGLDNLVAHVVALARARDVSFESSRVEIVESIYTGLLAKSPTPEEMQSALASLRTPADVRQLAAHCGDVRLRQVAKPAEIPNTKLDGDIRLVRTDKLADAQVVQMVDGFFDTESSFAWSKRTSSLLVTGRVTLYLSCNYLFPGEVREVAIESEGTTHVVKLADAYAAHVITVGGDEPVFVRFRANGAVSPKERGISNDSRPLAFQLWLRTPPLPKVIENCKLSGSGTGRKIYCVFSSKKEEDSLRPIQLELVRQEFDCESITTSQLGKRFHGRLVDDGVFLIASAETYATIRNAGLNGRFIYAEHGASPLKGYTYSGHYTHYDLALLPGLLWTERLRSLYPQAKTSYEAIGYPKLTVPRLSASERANACARLGVDPERPVVLFAPTWSGGDRESGLFNIRHLNPDGNMFAIPHDGDVRFANELANDGSRIHVLNAGESISYYYAVADILVSDVSSTAVEFASLGKPVVCLAMTRIPNFETRYHESPRRIRIPHTGQYWDFCSVVEPDLLQTTVDAVAAKVQPGEASTPSDALNALLCCHGDQATQRAVGAIRAFLRSDERCVTSTSSSAPG
ncbi:MULTISPECIES: CDP-glycerol glycerophosphotransferase family protein [Cupriavidus]|uniref:DUF4214 domain-containing protein n=1 Tax=Cupriavidus metallidurans TaxID=119219 RepID=A0A482IZH5_9BURK|nr:MULTISPECIES: CDP-glycerol glycerophosphotransferase family protein [Cupriavidus]KWR71422.1 hypothetical protein RN01_31595 [Cupriavidus sp. SHE]QBP13841.1 DUF4214 domain-containing protein [Cupriavidus metallidurans]QWC91618.1 DUF4214 domain-containing protein [Cupriavidus metallidurans]